MFSEWCPRAKKSLASLGKEALVSFRFRIRRGMFAISWLQWKLWCQSWKVLYRKLAGLGTQLSLYLMFIVARAPSDRLHWAHRRKELQDLDKIFLSLFQPSPGENKGVVEVRHRTPLTWAVKVVPNPQGTVHNRRWGNESSRTRGHVERARHVWSWMSAQMIQYRYYLPGITRTSPQALMPSAVGTGVHPSTLTIIRNEIEIHPFAKLMQSPCTDDASRNFLIAVTKPCKPGE